MMHAIISDTHSPKCLNKALTRLKQLVNDYPDIDSIVINGDMLGVFSMERSYVHNKQALSQSELDQYLESVTKRVGKKTKLTKQEALEYVEERYEWCIEKLTEAAQIKHTVFNLGNHESNYHFQALTELSFFNIQYEQPEQEELMQIFEAFEKKLYELEEKLEFNYIKDKHHVHNGTLILGIPGMSHATDGADELSKIQEAHTEKLIEQARKDLEDVHTVIIYNHTQGNYRDGRFNTASKSLAKFMQELPGNVKQKIYVQSHNHWAHTQFLKDDFHFILNNAGLHGGIFNLVHFNTLGVDCYDIDPETTEVIKLVLAENTEAEDVISRNYPNPEVVHKRKGEKKAPKKISPGEVEELRKRIFKK